MARSSFICALYLTLVVSSAAEINPSASCDISEALGTAEESLLDQSLSLVQLRASIKITPFELEKFCPHKCVIKNVKSERRLYAMEDEVGTNGEIGVGAIASGPTYDNQLWFIDSVGDDVYTLKNAENGRRMYAQQGHMGVEGIGALEVLPIWEDQKWFIENVGNDEFVLKDAYSYRRLFAHVGKDGKDGLGATDSDGVTEDQKWYIVPSWPKAPNAGEKVKAWAVPLEWTYTPSPDDGAVEPYGPNKWALVPDAFACAELGSQSPIDVNPGAAVQKEHEKASDLVLTTVGDCATPTYMLNEHTAEVLYTTDDCIQALKATWLGKDYQLEKFKYFSPSEHTLDGGYFPMEVAHVHKSQDYDSLIVSVLVSVAYDESGVDAGPSAFLSDVLARVPTPGDDKSNNRYQKERQTSKWNPYRDFIPDLSQGFFHYPGSMTRPPCTSGTTWIIAPTFVKIPSSTLTTFRELINSNPINQLATFGTITGKDETAVPTWAPASHMTEWSYELKCNIRPIQPLTGDNNPARVVTIVLPQNKTPIEFFQRFKFNAA